MIRKLKCFFGWHEWVLDFYIGAFDDVVISAKEIRKCKHCGKLRGSSGFNYERFGKRRV